MRRRSLEERERCGLRLGFEFYGQLESFLRISSCLNQFHIRHTSAYWKQLEASFRNGMGKTTAWAPLGPDDYIASLFLNYFKTSIHCQAYLGLNFIVDCFDLLRAGQNCCGCQNLQSRRYDFQLSQGHYCCWWSLKLSVADHERTYAWCHCLMQHEKDDLVE